MVIISSVELEPGTTYTASELRDIFDKSRAGRGIETLYDDNDNRFIRLFSKEASEYGDDLDADPMRYVGEKDFSNPAGDQVLNRGNGLLAESQNHDWPVFLFEKVSNSPVKHFYHGRVQVVNYEHNYRPNKDKREYDFYLKTIQDSPSETASRANESDDDLAPGELRDVNPTNRKEPESEEEISYTSNKESQAVATNEHENTVEELRDTLEATQWECHETDETDLLALSDSKALVIEVKSITDSNERKQIRKALGQVLENGYRDVQNRGLGDRELILSIAFSETPSDQFSGYFDFLQSRGIEVLWREEGEIKGLPESTEQILG
ncbi:hypothetical protein [Haloarcula sp. K1]|uniref:hypothetical protein n=1 Tax=Haloarcula sp. K1 TaxID=1622207 RepID=UPI0007BBC320|nr:hypothetical protein [Haloarcula sp. K1]KZX49530.1 hypothetical protein AV929_17600 [Haloarcula sp. K1]